MHLEVSSADKNWCLILKEVHNKFLYYLGISVILHLISNHNIDQDNDRSSI